MSYLVNLTIVHEPAVVVGAGSVALRKALGLLAAEASVTVIAPRACDPIRELADSGKLSWRQRPYRSGDLAGARLAVAATDDECVNVQVSRDARALGLLVNVADRPALCTFTLPAVLRRGSLTLAVATEGKCPAMARALKEDLEAAYGQEFGILLEVMGRLRAEMSARAWDSGEIQAALSGLYARRPEKLIRGGAWGELRDLVGRLLGEEFALVLPDHLPDPVPPS